MIRILDACACAAPQPSALLGGPCQRCRKPLRHAPHPTLLYSGAVRIRIVPTDKPDPYGKTVYSGAVILPDGREWTFDDLACHGDELRAAENALAFGAAYGELNRGPPEDVPSWAPPVEFADAIETHASIRPEETEVGEIPGGYAGEQFMCWRTTRAGVVTEDEWYGACGAERVGEP